VVRGHTCGETIIPVPHYFDTDPLAPSHPREVVLRLPETTVRLHSDAGVFGRGAVDSGTMFLLRRAPSPPLDGDILDLGTGYGPIAVTLGDRLVLRHDQQGRA